MGRTNVGNNHKSQGRKAVVERWYQALSSTPPTAYKNFQLVIDDATQRIQSINAEKSIETFNSQLFSNEFDHLSDETDPMAHNDDVNRPGVRTMKQLIEDIKRPLEEEIRQSKLGNEVCVVVNFDKVGAPLSKAPTQKKRKETIHTMGKGLFKTFLKEQKIENFAGIEMSEVPGFGEEYSITADEFRLKKLNGGGQVIFTWVNDLHNNPCEIRISDGDFITKVRQHSVPIFTYDELSISSRVLPNFSDFLRLDRKIPERLPEYLAKDRSNRQKLLNFICFELLKKDGEARIKIDSQSKVILDGHSLSRENLLTLGFAQEDIPMTDDDIYHTPISISFNKFNVRHLQFEHHLKNYLGETDFCAFFYITMIKPKTVKIISTDTDFIYYALMDLLQKIKFDNRKFEELPNIFLYRRVSAGGSGAYKRKVEGSAKVQDEWIHINLLYKLIKNDKKLSHLSDWAILALVGVMSLAGCDYTDSFYFVPHSHFFNALLEFSRDLGAPLVYFNFNTYQYEISIDVYSRFLALAYGMKFLNKFEPEQIFKKTSLEIIHIIESSQKDKKKHFPSVEDNVMSRLNLLYYFRLIEDLGKNKLTDRDLTEYGYGTNDGTAGLTYSNIIRVMYE